MTRGYSLEQDLSLLINNPKYSDIEILCAYEKQISFPKINSAGMGNILEYTYTGSVKEESLTKDIKNNNQIKSYSPELLSKFAEIMPLSENNIIINLFVELVATIPLNTIEFAKQVSNELMNYIKFLWNDCQL
ncbi:hypothetical protein C1645_873882 [Glomus cerebriforme]|uniref:BTB domain-containing protein n=1 Tax=Glomus cerebriforme TaxID=658196 RepID=A0A397T6G0_9GLOM|nr:hypothetical protein C1645_873882 [Glomus cerebriforme]